MLVIALQSAKRYYRAAFPEMARVFKSAIIGGIAALAMGVLAFAVAPLWAVVSDVYLAPAGTILEVLGNFAPFEKLTDWLVPEGGPAAGVLVIVASALLSWTIVFGTLHIMWSSLKRRRPKTRVG